MKNHLTKLMHLLKRGHLLVKKRALHVSKKHLKGHGLHHMHHMHHNMNHLSLGSGTPAHIKQWADISGSGFKKQGNIKAIKPLAFRF